MQIPYRVPMRLLVGSDELLALLQGHAAGLRELAGVEAERLSERPKGVATAVICGVECVIPLEGVVDFKEELARLEKVITKVEKDIAQLDRRLGNKGFTDRAPAEVVAEVQAKRDEAANGHATRQPGSVAGGAFVTLNQLVQAALTEDIGSATSRRQRNDGDGLGAHIVAKQELVVSGHDAAAAVFQTLAHRYDWNVTTRPSSQTVSLSPAIRSLHCTATDCWSVSGSR